MAGVVRNIIVFAVMLALYMGASIAFYHWAMMRDACPVDSKLC